MTPQPTEQYGQVLRVSVVRASLNVRTSARTRSGANPRAVRLVAPMPVADTLKNCRRVNAIADLPVTPTILPSFSGVKPIRPSPMGTRTVNALRQRPRVRVQSATRSVHY